MDLHEAVCWRELEQVAFSESERRAKDIQERANVVCAGVGKSATPAKALAIPRQVRLKRPVVSNKDDKRGANADNDHDVVLHFLAP